MWKCSNSYWLPFGNSSEIRVLWRQENLSVDIPSVCHEKVTFGTSTWMILKLLVISLRFNDRCTDGIVVKLHMSCWSPFSFVTKQKDPSAAAHLCVSGVIVRWSSLVKTYRSGKGTVLPESWLCALSSSLYSPSSSRESALAADPCELAAGSLLRRQYWNSSLRFWRGSRLILRFFIVFIWIHNLKLLGLLRCARLLFGSIFVFLRCLWTLSPCVFLTLWWSWMITHPILWIHGCWVFIITLSCLILLYSSRYNMLLLLTSIWGWSGSTTCCCCWLDRDRCLCLSPCCGWSSSSSPSPTGIGISWGSCGEGRGCGCKSLARGISCFKSLSTTCWWWSWRPSWRKTRRTRWSWMLMRFRRRRRLWTLWTKRELQDHQRRYKLVEMDNWYHRLLLSQVWSAGADVPNFLSRIQPFSTYTDQMRSWRNWIGLQDKPSRQLVLNGFSRRVPKQWIHRWQRRCQSCLPECPAVSYSTQAAYSAKMTSKNWHVR